MGNLQVTCYSTGAEGFDEAFGAAVAKFLKLTRPAMVGVKVGSLLHPAAHFEIAVEAYLPKK